MHIYPLGDAALVLEIGTRIDEQTHLEVQRVWRQIEAAKVPGVIEVVPAYTTVTVFYEPRQLAEAGADPTGAFQGLKAQIDAAARATSRAIKPARGRVVEIPVCYGGAFGPDLDLVAKRTKLSSEEVCRLHCSTEYLVYLLGFAPGFPYLGGLPAALHTPRLAKPRTRVPAGSVAIAGGQSGIYPIVTPGGWNLIGRTPLKLFRPSEGAPTLLHPGDRVRFRSITPQDFAAAEEVV